MKKLLSLLSVLTTSGIAMPTVIAASPYEKQEHNNNWKTNNLREIMDLDSNNLENVNRENRHERDRSRRIFKLNEKIIINQNNPREYRNSFNTIIEELVNNNIFRIIFG